MNQTNGKTLFIILDLGISIRNILRTDVFHCLRNQENLRIVIFSTLTDQSFKDEFQAENVIIEPLPRLKPNGLVKLIQSAKKDLWAESKGIFTFINRRKKKERFLTRWLLIKPLKGIYPQGIDLLLSALSRLEMAFTPDLNRDIFEKYKPDLVFYTTLYTKYLSLELSAQKRKIKTISFIQSWDNPTSKGPFPVTPDRVIVWNEILQKEVLRFHNMPKDRIHITGVPQFDLYLDRENFLGKEAFCEKWNLDPHKKLITYTTGSSNMLPLEHEVIEGLYQELFVNKRCGHPCQLLVRPHPKDDFDYAGHFQDYPCLVIQQPGPRAATKDKWNPKREDMYGLAELMLHTDLVVNIASTITIDAACFDTPIINVAYDGHAAQPYMDSCRRYYDYDHYKNILKTGGVRLAGDREELIAQINSYLEDRDQDSQGRRRIVREQCWKLDGRSGQRIASVVLDYLKR
ncbi:MAG: CDP-glycerol glycerophosphotransferase family protein [Desulfohalobiaceae bacterium]|nr:CDP-glycerol glycerophosphotransferase family protein [Desulfohalobiaceae bacterium]